MISFLIQFLKSNDKVADICPVCYAAIIRAVNLKKAPPSPRPKKGILPASKRRKRRNSGHGSLKVVLG
jgi:hypothetical protein